MAPEGLLAASKTRRPIIGGLERERLLLTLRQSLEHRLTLVLGPPGAGKTTALAHYAGTVDIPTAWYRAEPTDGGADTMVAYVAQAVSTAIGRPVGGEEGLLGLVTALEEWRESPLLLVVDDLHTLEGSAAESALERLICLAPPSLRVLASARRAPLFNLPRLRLDGDLLELDGADLRFRSWEVEQLFGSVYQEPLPPEDLATLSRRTEGWAAGLQLFHLATTGKPWVVRRRAVANLAVESRLVRGYLTQNVLDDLPRDLRTFLVETSVLGRLTPELCDRLLGRAGSAELLDEIARRQLFLIPLGDVDTYRLHEVLRSQLEVLLVAGVGREEAGRRYTRAGWLLEGAHALPEALLAYSRAGLSSDVRRLLGDRGERLGAEPGGWVELLPTEMSEHDPWLVLAQARRATTDGRPATALEAYRRAETLFGSAPPAVECRVARGGVALWAEAAPLASGHWSEPLRAALQRNPAAQRRWPVSSWSPEQQLVQAFVRLLCGQLAECRRMFDLVLDHPQACAWIRAAAAAGSALSILMEGRAPSAFALLRSARLAEDDDLPWLARLARALAAAASEPPHQVELAAIRATCAGRGDAWGSALVLLLQTLAALRTGADPEELAAAAEDALNDVGAGVLAAVAAAVAGLGAAVRERDRNKEPAARARAQGRSVGSRWAQLLAALASGSERELAALAQECGVDPSSLRSAMLGKEPAPPAAGGKPQIRCLGGFAIGAAAGDINLNALKPRCQELLKMLCARPGRLVHRDELIDALWPRADAAGGQHNLHVAVSSLRRFFAGAVGDGAVVEREASAYRLAAPERIGVDVLAFTTAAAAGLRATEPATRRSALVAALGLYQGDLLPDTTSDWVVAIRDSLQQQAADAALALGELLLRGGQPREAARACRLGLRADDHRDDLWRLLIAALSRSQDPAAKAKAEVRYRQLLDSLGVPGLLTTR
jgi:DNA-binding SARP family transcriptional activator